MVREKGSKQASKQEKAKTKSQVGCAWVAMQKKEMAVVYCTVLVVCTVMFNG